MVGGHGRVRPGGGRGGSGGREGAAADPALRRITWVLPDGERVPGEEDNETEVGAGWTRRMDLEETAVS